MLDLSKLKHSFKYVQMDLYYEKLFTFYLKLFIATKR